MTDELTTRRIHEIEVEIRECVKRTSREILIIGLRLQEAHDILLGGFQRWVETELGMSIRLARNCMYVAGRFGEQSAIIAELPPTILYNLAAPSTSDEVIDAVFTRIQNGEDLKVKDVKAIQAAHRSSQPDARRTVDETIQQASADAIEEVSETGAISVNGESMPVTPVTMSAAINERAAEYVRADTQTLVNRLEREEGVTGWLKYTGECKVDYVDRTGRITLFASELVTKLRRGMKVRYILYVDPEQQYLTGNGTKPPESDL